VLASLIVTVFRRLIISLLRCHSLNVAVNAKGANVCKLVAQAVLADGLATVLSFRVLQLHLTVA